LFACIRVNQKFIKRKEDNPTPSQPTNICKKLLEVTSMSIKKVNSDKYDIKRSRWGSPSIYAIEYRCTRKDIKVTTRSIIAVKLSKQKDHSIFKESTQIQDPRVSFIDVYSLIKERNKVKEYMKDRKIKDVVVTQTPNPRKRPNKIPLIKPSKGIKTIKKSIL
jgi:hypothetical protein